jgi:hypothetical protein
MFPEIKPADYPKIIRQKITAKIIAQASARSPVGMPCRIRRTPTDPK